MLSLTTVACFLFFNAAPASTSQLLASVQIDFDGTIPESSECTTFALILAHRGNHELGDVLLASWPPTFDWTDGFVGSFDLSNVYENPPFFPYSTMVRSITDGSSEEIYVFGSIQGCNRQIADYGPVSESTFFALPSDLIGNQVDRIRLIIDGLQIEQSGKGDQYQLSATYQFWGTPVPEPAEFTLVLLAAVFARPRRIQRLFAGQITRR